MNKGAHTHIEKTGKTKEISRTDCRINQENQQIHTQKPGKLVVQIGRLDRKFEIYTHLKGYE